jgi:hypothetical protein
VVEAAAADVPEVEEVPADDVLVPEEEEVEVAVFALDEEVAVWTLVAELLLDDEELVEVPPVEEDVRSNLNTPASQLDEYTILLTGSYAKYMGPSMNV